MFTSYLQREQCGIHRKCQEITNSHEPFSDSQERSHWRLDSKSIGNFEAVEYAFIYMSRSR